MKTLYVFSALLFATAIPSFGTPCEAVLTLEQKIMQSPEFSKIKEECESLSGQTMTLWRILVSKDGQDFDFEGNPSGYGLPSPQINQALPYFKSADGTICKMVSSQRLMVGLIGTGS